MAEPSAQYQARTDLFAVDVEKLTAFNNTLSDIGEYITELRKEANQAMLDLTQAPNTWTGNAQAAACEMFLEWITGMNGLVDLITELGPTLDLVTQSAGDIIWLSDKLPQQLDVAYKGTPAGTGALQLDFQFEPTGDFQKVIDPDISGLYWNNEQALNINIDHGGFEDVGCALQDVHKALCGQNTQMTNFKLAYAAVSSAVTNFENAYQPMFDDLEANNTKNWSTEFLNTVNGNAFGFTYDNFTDLTKSMLEHDNSSGLNSFNPNAISTDGQATDANEDLPELSSGAPEKAARAYNLLKTGADLNTAYQKEYNRNPYLPESTKVERAEAAESVEGAQAINAWTGEEAVAAIVGGPAGAAAAITISSVESASADDDSNGDGLSNFEQDVDDITGTPSAPDIYGRD
jgi:uncharacterized protein YukE